MKFQQFCEPKSGMVVHQLPEGVTSIHLLLLGHLRDYWKRPAKENNSENGLKHCFIYGET